MKRYIFYLVTILIFLSTASLSQVVYIDINKVLNDSTAGKKALKLLENEIKNKNSKFDVTQKKLVAEEKKILAKKNIISDEDFRNEIAKLRKKIKEYNLNKNNELKKLNEKKNSLTNIFMNKINPIIADYASNNDISIVIRKEYMIIGKTELDISNNILKIVNDKIKEIN